MIPRVAQRGHSFKGAGEYYLHDKEANTSERVGWTYTHNLPTNDPQKAMKIMAFTATHADDIKKQAGVKTTGRKATAGAVYSFSLAWHPEQSPDKKEMLNASMSTLEKLGLTEHQAVIVSHQETEHPHVHVICNLVNPDTGKTARVSHDQLKLSKWAEEYEVKTGQVYCNDRIENNRKREELAQQKTDDQEKTQSAIVKHREKRNQRADLVQSLYERSDSGKAFRSALEEHDLTLAKGDRRGFVLVDRNGEVFSLSRQLKGQRASDLKSRLGNIQDLLDAKTLSEERMYFDRDQYEIDRQNAMSDEAIKERNKKMSFKKNYKKAKNHTELDLSFMNENDRIFEDMETSRRKREEFLTYKKKLDDFYKIEDLEKRIKVKEEELNKKSKLFSRFKKQKDSTEIDNLKRTLRNAQNRYKEQMDGLKKRLDERHDLEAKMTETKNQAIPKMNNQPKKDKGIDPNIG